MTDNTAHPNTIHPNNTHITLVPPPTGPVVNFGTLSSRETIDFAELFLYNNPSITNLDHAGLIFPYWECFVRLYLSLHWPSDSRFYFKWLLDHGLCMGSDRGLITPLDQFLRLVSFPATLYALSLPLFRQPGNGIHQLPGPLCSERSLDGENGFERVGHVLWERRSVGLHWHITEAQVALYHPFPRL
jgi:hypothetical protein